MDERYPIHLQIACIILTALFVWTFSIAREPRQWRRLFQTMFSKPENFSVNKNKVIDENLKSYGIIVAMVILVADVACFVTMVTDKERKHIDQLKVDDWFRINEQSKIQGSSPNSNRAGL